MASRAALAGGGSQVEDGRSPLDGQPGESVGDALGLAGEAGDPSPDGAAGNRQQRCNNGDRPTVHHPDQGKSDQLDFVQATGQAERG
jgi:hypothetical protein